MMEQAMKLLVPRLSRSLRLPKSFHAPQVSLPPINLKLLRKLKHHGLSSILQIGNLRPG